MDPKKRLTGTEALQHDYFKKFAENAEVNEEEDVLDLEVVERLKEFKGGSTLKKAALNIMVKLSHSKELDHLGAEFKKIDVDGTGMIEEDELALIFKKSNIAMTDEQIREMITEIDYQGNGKINYTEFLAATINLNTFLDESKLKTIFAMMDTDQSGELTHDNIRNAMMKLGMDMSCEEICDIIKKHDFSNDKSINFEEFKQIFSLKDAERAPKPFMSKSTFLDSNIN